MKLTLPLWKRVIVGKYGYEERGWCTKEVKEGYGVGIWKTIIRGWEALKDRIGFKVSSSNKVNFWLDKWCGDTTLRDSFLILYSKASSKVVSVRVSVFAREATWVSILTLDQLRRRG
ncbi:hypothetical protein AAG906_001135 [Vitis piasezkii]